MRLLMLSCYKTVKIVVTLLMLHLINIELPSKSRKHNFKCKSTSLRLFQVKTQIKSLSKKSQSLKLNTKRYCTDLDETYNYSINVLYKPGCSVEEVMSLNFVSNFNTINLINCNDLTNKYTLKMCFLVRYPKLPIILIALHRKKNLSNYGINKLSIVEDFIKKKKLYYDYYMIYSISSIYHIERMLNLVKSFYSNTNENSSNNSYDIFTRLLTESLGAVKIHESTIEESINELNDSSLVVLTYILVWIILRFILIKVINYRN